MEQKTPPRKAGSKPRSREDRLSAALKANMARRKAQAKARAGVTSGKTAGSDKDKG